MESSPRWRNQTAAAICGSSSRSRRSRETAESTSITPPCGWGSRSRARDCQKELKSSHVKTKSVPMNLATQSGHRLAFIGVQRKAAAGGSGSTTRITPSPTNWLTFGVYAR